MSAGSWTDVKNYTSFVSVSHRRLDVKPEHDSDPDKKHSDKNRIEKHNDEHKNKKTHVDDLWDEKHQEEPQHDKQPKEIRKEKHLEESKQQRPAEDAQLQIDNKKQKHVQDLQIEKLKPEPRKERLLEEPKKMRHVEEVKKDKRPEEPRKHSYTDDMKKYKHREDSRRERPINTLQRERLPSETPADAHRPIFERWEWRWPKNWLSHIKIILQCFRLNYIFQERSVGQHYSVSHPVPLSSSTCSASSPDQTPLCGHEKRQVRTLASSAWRTEMFSLMLHDITVSELVICTDICSYSFISGLVAWQDAPCAWCMLWWVTQVCLYWKDFVHHRGPLSYSTLICTVVTFVQEGR